MKDPKPIPSSDPIPFATSDVDDALWPIISSHAQKFEVNYIATDNTQVGIRPGRQFLASRSNGTRRHLAVDLFASHRDIVVACEDGRIVSYYGFYPTSTGEMSYALFVEHEDFVVNYGEVKGDAQEKFGWRIGDRVTKGQKIAHVSTTDMIHFETYILGTTQNERWMVGGPRPQRLLNPTLYLLNLAASAQGIAGPDPGGTGGTGDGGGSPAGDTLKHSLLASNTELQAAASGQRAFMRDRDHGEPVGIIQDALDRVLGLEDRINAGSNRGTFGPKTERAVKAFQQRSGILADGLVGREVLLKLDAALIQLGGDTPAGPGNGGQTQPLDQILQIAENSDIARYNWPGRGRAPLGYTKGMALVFARAYCKFKAGNAAAVEMARANTGDATRDVLAHYADIFAALGMNNSVAGPDTLRHLFALLLGLGMRESSGNYCEGRDMSTDNTDAETAEAGLFQTSYNARNANPLLPQLFQQYQANPAGFLNIFKEGASCSPGDFVNHGSGPGKEFQRLSKESPAFAAEFAAVALRNIRRHWGPINAQKAEVRPAADEMFRQVQAAVDASNLCPLVV